MAGEASTGRLEAFSDGVFAIAITLLILDVSVKPDGGSLAERLAGQWPSYVAFVVSFALIGIMWLSHDQMLRDIRRVDHGLIVANLALLLCVTVIPFPTRVVADAFTHGDVADRRTAALLYALTFVALSLAFNTLWLWAARGRRLLKPDAPQARIDARTRRSLLSIPTFIVATVVALGSPEASVALDGAIALLYLVPSAAIDRLLVPELRAVVAPQHTGDDLPSTPG